MNPIGKYIASAYNNSPCLCHKATHVHVIPRHTISATYKLFTVILIHNSNTYTCLTLTSITIVHY
jgi:hypothetical protein